MLYRECYSGPAQRHGPRLYHCLLRRSACLMKRHFVPPTAHIGARICGCGCVIVVSVSPMATESDSKQSSVAGIGCGFFLFFSRLTISYLLLSTYERPRLLPCLTVCGEFLREAVPRIPSCQIIMPTTRWYCFWLQTLGGPGQPAVPG